MKECFKEATFIWQDLKRNVFPLSEELHQSDQQFFCVKPKFSK